MGTKTRDEFGQWLSLVHGFAAECSGLVEGRRFRADWCKPFSEGTTRAGVVVEYDGVLAGGPGHESKSGIMRDQAKSNLLQLAGWVVVRCNAATIRSGECHGWVEAALGMGAS